MGASFRKLMPLEAWKPVAEVFCLFRGLWVGSSSSDDNVRSMTAAAGRFALVVAMPRGALAELSLPPDAGVPMIGVLVLGVSNRRLTMLISEISRSSSSSNVVPLDFRFSSRDVFIAQWPFGSIVTFSRSLGVFAKISRTYLQRGSQNRRFCVLQ